MKAYDHVIIATVNLQKAARVLPLPEIINAADRLQELAVELKKMEIANDDTPKHKPNDKKD